jgi:hypothetical protein
MRSMGTTSRGLAVALALALATPAAADDFCTALKRVVASAPQGFAGIRGPADPEYPASYWRPLALPGAEAQRPGGSPCFILHGANMRPSDQYHCDFPGGADRQALLQDMHDLADEVSTCLAPMFSDDAAGVWRLAVGGTRVVVGGAAGTPETGAGVVELIVEPVK